MSRSKGDGMFWVLAALVCLLWFLGMRAFAADYTAHRLTAAGLSVTNDQQNSCWELASLLIHYQKPATQDVQVVRVSGGVSYVLAVLPAGSTNVVWWAERPVPFKCGDWFTLGSGGGTGTVQVIKQAEGR